MASETLSELLKRIAYQAFANGEIEMDQRDALVAAYGDLVSALKECALQIAQNHKRRLTLDEQAALDNARIIIAKAVQS